MFTSLKASITDFRRYLPLLYNLTTRDIKVKYRRSVLGLAWSVLNPLLTMLVLTQVFGLLLKLNVPNFPVYYILGSTMYNFFSESTTSSMSSITGSASLIKKVHIPKYLFPLEKCVFAGVNFMFSMVAVAIVMVLQTPLQKLTSIVNPELPVHPVIGPSWTMLLFFLPFIYCFIFSVGASLILSTLTVFFRDILHLYSVFLTVLMYLTPIIYPMDLIENSKVVYTIVKCNPMYYYVQYFRDVMMYGKWPGLKWDLTCIGLSLLFLFVGLWLFKKKQDKFILYV